MRFLPILNKTRPENCKYCNKYLKPLASSRKEPGACYSCIAQQQYLLNLRPRPY